MRAVAALLAGATVLLTSCGSGGPRPAAGSTGTASTPAPATSATSSAASSEASSAASRSRSGVPAFAHIVVVVLENHRYSSIIDRPDAPFLNALADSGALLTRSYAVTHPSEPNYLALFSGSTQGLTDDSCPHTYTTPNLGSALRQHGQSFVGYSEDLPSVGFTGCATATYARKHNPWVNFPALPASVNQPLTAFPRDYERLPTLAFVIPNIVNDMHDGTVAQGDAWLRAQLSGYAAWSRTHDSLLVVTTDEDDESEGNRITTIFAGAHVRAGRYDMRVDHYGVLRTLLDSCGVPPFAHAASAAPITAIWQN